MQLQGVLDAFVDTLRSTAASARAGTVLPDSMSEGEPVRNQHGEGGDDRERADGDCDDESGGDRGRTGGEARDNEGGEARDDEHSGACGGDCGRCGAVAVNGDTFGGGANGSSGDGANDNDEADDEDVEGIDGDDLDEPEYDSDGGKMMLCTRGSLTMTKGPMPAVPMKRMPNA